MEDRRRVLTDRKTGEQIWWTISKLIQIGRWQMPKLKLLLVFSIHHSWFIFGYANICVWKVLSPNPRRGDNGNGIDLKLVFATCCTFKIDWQKYFSMTLTTAYLELDPLLATGPTIRLIQPVSHSWSIFSFHTMKNFVSAQRRNQRNEASWDLSEVYYKTSQLR